MVLLKRRKQHHSTHTRPAHSVHLSGKEREREREKEGEISSLFNFIFFFFFL